MADNQDARPFVDLKKDADEFRQKFDEDIQKCMSYLDAKLSALICEPESLGSPSKKNAFKTNPLVEFSKTKYEIFISVKSMINEMEREWLKYVSEMKKLFIENVEILLAGTKLEVKLPTNEYSEFKKSPLKDRTSIADSIYPIINTFAKNVAAIGSPLFNKDDSDNEIKQAKKIAKSTSSPRKYVEKELSSSEDDSGNITRRSTRNSNDKSLKHSFVTQSDELNRDSMKVMLTKLDAIGLNATYQNSETTKTIDKSELSSSENEVFTPKRKGRQQSRKIKQIEIMPAKIGETEDESCQVSRLTTVESVKRTTRSGRTPSKSVKSSVPAKIIESEDESYQATTLTAVESVRTTRSDRTSAKSRTSTRQKRSITSEESGTESNNLQSAATSRKKKAPPTQKLDISSVRVKRKTNTDVPNKAISNEDAVEVPNSMEILQSSSPKKRNLLRPAAGLSKSPKKVTFASNQETFDDIDVSTSINQPTTSRRRKTMVPKLDEITIDIDITPRTSRSLPKRKTISGISNITSSIDKISDVSKDMKYESLSERSTKVDNVKSDDNYSDWMPLKSIDAKIPAKPGIYEVKVWRAKKPAYIGHCESLRHMLTLHKLKQNSGHKHLDKFIDRNIDDIQIRFEVISSIDIAKSEAKDRVKCFVTQYHTTPAYN